MHTAGMPSLGVRRAITANAAEMLGWQDREGAIEPGEIRRSRGGRWIADISELERVRFGMKDG